MLIQNISLGKTLVEKAKNYFSLECEIFTMNSPHHGAFMLKLVSLFLFFFYTDLGMSFSCISNSFVLFQ